VRDRDPVPDPGLAFLAVHHAQQDLAVAVEAVRGLEQVHQLGDRLALAARAKPRRDRLGVEQFGEAHGTVPWVAVGTCGQGSQPREHTAQRQAPSLLPGKGLHGSRSLPMRRFTPGVHRRPAQAVRSGSPPPRPCVRSRVQAK
jgi:hypothetical protein